MRPSIRPPWSSTTKILVTAIVLAGVIYLMSRFSAVFIPLALGCILAFVLTPPVNLLQHRLNMQRWVAILLMYLLLLVVIAGILMILIPMLLQQIHRITIDLDDMIASVRQILSQNIVVFGQTIDLRGFSAGLSTTLQGLIQPAFGRTIDFVAHFLSSLVWVTLTFVIAFYLIKDSRGLSNWLENLAPPGYKEDFVRLRDEINQIWSAFFRSQLILALVVACIQTAICFILGLRFALLLGLLAGILEFVPSLGHSIWFILAGTTAFFGGSMWLHLQNWVVLVILAGVDVIFVQFDMNYLIPRIVGRKVRLPPLVVILGILAGASIAGVLGIVLASPSIASLRVIGRYIYARVFDLEPFPENSLSATPLPAPEMRWWQKRTPRLHPEPKERQA